MWLGMFVCGDKPLGEEDLAKVLIFHQENCEEFNNANKTGA